MIIDVLLHSFAPELIATSKASSCLNFFYQFELHRNYRKDEVDPFSPNLPPFFCKIVLIVDAVLFLFSVKVSIINAVLKAPYPSYLKFS